MRVERYNTITDADLEEMANRALYNLDLDKLAQIRSIQNQRDSERLYEVEKAMRKEQ
jgi:hypothetical protein